MKRLPHRPESANVQVLAQEYREEFTGVTGTTITLQFPPIRTTDDIGLELIFKNGSLIDGASAGASSAARERFTGITAATFTLAAKPVVGVELVFKNGALLDGRAAQTAAVSAAFSTSASVKESKLEDFTGGTSASLTLAHAADSTNCLVFKNGSALRRVAGASGYSVSGTAVTLGTAPIAADVILVWYQWSTTTSVSGTASQTLTVDPAPGTYTMSAAGVITPSVAPIAADVWTVWYLTGGAATGGPAGYTIDGVTVTFATALVATDSVVVLYPYRT